MCCWGVSSALCGPFLVSGDYEARPSRLHCGL